MDAPRAAPAKLGDLREACVRVADVHLGVLHTDRFPHDELRGGAYRLPWLPAARLGRSSGDRCATDLGARVAGTDARALLLETGHSPGARTAPGLGLRGGPGRCARRGA